MTNQYEHIGAYIVEGPQEWQVFQRGDDGTAQIKLSGVWTCEEPGYSVQVRVVREDTNRPPCAACDWQDAQVTGKNAWKITLKGVPTGGLYKIETSLRKPFDPWRQTGDRIFHLAVGDLWIIAGQSNAAGYGHGPVDDPPCLCVHMFGADLRWRLATHPLHDTTRTQHPANRDGGFVDHTPWLAFGRQVHKATGVPIGLLPLALGGAPLSMYDPASDNPVLYTTMMDVIEEVGGAATGMVWYQGESDADPANARTYAERFTRFVGAVRDALGRPGLPVITAQLNHVEGEFKPLESKGWGMIREAQRQLAKALPNVAVLPTLDLSLSDGIHTSAFGNMALAERFSRAALAVAYGHDVRYLAPDLARATFAGNGRTVLLEFENVRGAWSVHKYPIQEFIVEDDAGEVVVEAVEIEGHRLLLTLARETDGGVRVHGALSPDPATSLRDEDERPILGFCDVPVE
ncbi:MAG: hypothetical protein HQ592_03310 [Planctomycetes bacterium]|nr:hypothetical protein [Planctomycetota bacterium]